MTPIPLVSELVAVDEAHPEHQQVQVRRSPFLELKAPDGRALGVVVGEPVVERVQVALDLFLATSEAFPLLPRIGEGDEQRDLELAAVERAQEVYQPPT